MSAKLAYAWAVVASLFASVFGSRCKRKTCATYLVATIPVRLDRTTVHVFVVNQCPKCGRGYIEVSALGNMDDGLVAKADVASVESAIAAIRDGKAVAENGEIKFGS